METLDAGLQQRCIPPHRPARPGWRASIRLLLFGILVGVVVAAIMDVIKLSIGWWVYSGVFQREQVYQGEFSVAAALPASLLFGLLIGSVISVVVVVRRASELASCEVIGALVGCLAGFLSPRRGSFLLGHDILHLTDAPLLKDGGRHWTEHVPIICRWQLFDGELLDALVLAIAGGLLGLIFVILYSRTMKNRPAGEPQ